MNDIYEFTPSMRLLITMHNLSAIDSKSAKKVEDLTGICDMTESELEPALRELLLYGYVVNTDHLYYLSSLGIAVIRSIYT